MGWREMMGSGDKKQHSKFYPQKPQKEQKVKNTPTKKAFATIAPFALRDQEYKFLWQKAWELADWIDNPDSNVPWQERAAKVPELEEMSRRIDELIQQRDSNQANSFCKEFTPYVDNRKTTTLGIDTCPARCKQTDKGYGRAWFDHKPGKAALCVGDQCPWIDKS